MNKLYKLLIFVFLFSFTCCGITDNDSQNGSPGRRDYKWSADTLNTDGTIFSRVWASSSSDIWMIATIGGLSNNIYRYSNNNWKKFSIPEAFSPTAIWGSSENDVWIVGSDLFWHYDGIKVQKTESITIDGYNSVSTQKLYGTSENDIYALGWAANGTTYKALFAKYNGEHWSEIGMPEINKIFIGMAKNTEGDYLINALGYNPTGPDTNAIYMWNGTTITEIYNGYDNGTVSCGVSSINGNTYALIANNLYKFNNKKLTFLREVPLENLNVNFYGRNENDLFFVAKNSIVHFNGTDFKTIYNFDNNIILSGAVIFNNKVFFVFAKMPNSNIIVQGTLY